MGPVRMQRSCRGDDVGLRSNSKLHVSRSRIGFRKVVSKSIRLTTKQFYQALASHFKSVLPSLYLSSSSRNFPYLLPLFFSQTTHLLLRLPSLLLISHTFSYALDSSASFTYSSSSPPLFPPVSQRHFPVHFPQYPISPTL